MENNIEQAIGAIESRMAKALKAVNDSLDSRIATTVKTEIANSIEFNVNNHLKAIEKITVDKPLSIEQLTRLYNDVYRGLQDLKINANGYGLYEQMQQLNNTVQNSQSQVQELSNNVKKLIDDKYIKTDITKKELWDLYSLTKSTQDELAQHFKVSIPTVYKWLNCQTKDIKAQNELKLYLERKLEKQKEAVNA